MGDDMNSRQKEKLAKLLMQGVDSVLMYRMIESFIENEIEGKGNSRYAPERDIDTVQTGGYTPRPIAGARLSPPGKE